MEIEMFIVVWSAYNDWYSSKPFLKMQDAVKHRDRWIIDPRKDYHKNIQIIPIMVNID